jgi:hypothetical protein
MRRLVIGVAAGLLLCPLTIASSAPACASTRIQERMLSRLVVRPSLTWSVGLITVEQGGGKVRVRAKQAETSVKVTSVTWTGDTLPTTLWVGGGVLGAWWPGSTGPAPVARMTPGTQWVVSVSYADGHVSHALAVSGNTVLVPAQLHAKDDVDGCDPAVVNLEALRRAAQRR